MVQDISRLTERNHRASLPLYKLIEASAKRTALMRKVTLGLANSLDNYIARKDGGFDWIHWSKEVAEISAKFMKTVEALLIGRKTYEGMLAYGQTSYPGAKNYVFSRSTKKRAALKKKLAAKKRVDKNVEVSSEDATKFVRKLKRQKGKGIV